MNYEVMEKTYLDNFINSNVTRIEENCDALQKVLTDAILKRTVPQVWEELKGQADKFEAISNYLQINDNIEKQKIYYYSSIRTMLEVSHVVSEQIEKIQEFNEYKKFTHLFSILEILYRNESVSQSAMARRLKMSDQSLSNFFKRTNKFELWKSQKEGRSQCYSINFKGKKVYKEYLKRNLEKEPIETEQLLIYLVDEIAKQIEKRNPEVDEIITTLNERWGKKVSLFSTEMLRFKINALFVRRDMEYRRRDIEYRETKRRAEEKRRNWILSQETSEQEVIYNYSQIYEKNHFEDEMQCVEW